MTVRPVERSSVGSESEGTGSEEDTRGIKSAVVQVRNHDNRKELGVSSWLCFRLLEERQSLPLPPSLALRHLSPTPPSPFHPAEAPPILPRPADPIPVLPFHLDTVGEGLDLQGTIHCKNINVFEMVVSTGQGVKLFCHYIVSPIEKVWVLFWITSHFQLCI